MERDKRVSWRTPKSLVSLIGIGLLSGYLSGLFGVGGGTIIVPLLVLLLGFDQRMAAATSLAAIVPTTAVGVISYAAHGSVAWVPAIILAAFAVVGAQVGTWLLARLSQTVLRWGFIGFLLVVIVSLFLVIPSREAHLELTWASGVGLATVGLITGVLAGVLGVGGGIVVVPALIVLFGTSDLEAKGTSMLMMIPTALSGTISNLGRKLVNVPAALVVGLTACTTTALGALTAVAVSPLVANILFATYLAYIAVQMAVKTIRSRGSGGAAN